MRPDAGRDSLVRYVVDRLELMRERRPALAWWMRTRAHLLSRETGAADFAAYTRTASAIIRKLDALPEAQRAELLRVLKIVLIDPALVDGTWTPERADESLVALGTVVVRLAHALRIPVPAHSQPLALARIPLARIPQPEIA